MSRLVCLLKGCSISKDRAGYVICPDCQMPYCWDKKRGPWGTTYFYMPPTGYTRYPFGNWIPCDHGTFCNSRRLHKNRNDSLAAFVLENEKLGTRHERFKPCAPKKADL